MKQHPFFFLQPNLARSEEEAAATAELSSALFSMQEQ